MTLPDKIRTLRKKAGWSQVELAEKLSVHAGHVNRLEKGHYQPSIELLKKLAQLLGVTTDYLLNDELENPDAIFNIANTEDKTMIERAKLLDSLDPDERQAIFKIIDGLLTKKKMIDFVVKEAHLTVP